MTYAPVKGARQIMSAITVKTAMERHWDGHIAHLTPGYRRGVRSKFAQVVEGLGEVPVSRLTAADITAYTTRQLTTPPVQTRKHGTPTLTRLQAPKTGRALSTVIGEATQLQAAVQALVDDPGCEITKNTAARARKIVRAVGKAHKLSAEDREAWEEHELGPLFQVIDEMAPWIAPHCRFALGTGCRQGEVLGLTTSSVDITNGRVVIVRNKTNKRREVAIPGGVLVELSTHLQKQRTVHRRVGDMLVFPARGGTRYDASNFGRDFRLVQRAAEARGLPTHPFHCFRHTFVSRFLAQHDMRNAPWAANQVGMSLQVFLDTYAHLLRTDMDMSFAEVPGC